MLDRIKLLLSFLFIKKVSYWFLRCDGSNYNKWQIKNKKKFWIEYDRKKINYEEYN